MKRYGTILSGSASTHRGGNSAEFPDIRSQLRQRSVNWFERELDGSSTAFWFYESELPKLPTDFDPQQPNRIPEYLPVDEGSGHGISGLDRFLDRNPGTDVPYVSVLTN